ncbi:MAG: M20 family metallo-hydrolase [Treponema sp.]|nr:M20 family metallo-hydrolase [Treponema sp.]
MKDKLFAWIEKSSCIAVELETELTKYPAISPESAGEGELDKCIFLENWLKSHGITQLERYDVPDENAKGSVRPNLIATIKGSADENEGCLWIISHIDVVPPGDEKLWDNNPWTVVKKDDPNLGTILVGRGVEDNQQGLVSSVLAAMAFTKQGLVPYRTVKLLFASDEEVGSVYGMEWLVKNKGDLFKKNDMVLVPDGGDPKGENIEIAEKNILWLKITTSGKQSHGSRPDLGANAFLAGSDLALKLHCGLSDKFCKRDPMFNPDYSTFQPTKKEANVPNINTIPSEDIFYMDMRILPEYSVKSVLSEVDRIKKEIEINYNVKIEYTPVQLLESKPTAAQAPVVKLLSRAIRQVYDVNPRLIGIGGGTMAAYLRNAGIDCAVWTKTQSSLHQPNEFVLLDNITGDAKVMTLLMINE